MGEVVLSSSEPSRMMELPTHHHKHNPQNTTPNPKPDSTPEAEAEAAADASASSSSVVRWDRFLPKLAVRVLLVEADDSTRQIIAALLRKCSYKVAAVPDGLKAWEVLKERSQNIDLILTEVELPSISGYALLTLIMEHDVCKSIPVIMMSAHDSVSTVYKCMLRGAADFLVKPVRKNELRNLWQHVWRRQASRSSAAVAPPDESVAQQKVEATAENNAVSNHSSGYMACIQRNRECIDKGSDAQSSCTKPELDTEGAEVEHVHGLSQPKVPICLSNDLLIYSEKGKIPAHDKKEGDSQAVATVDANYGTARGWDKNIDTGWEQVDGMKQTVEHNHVPNNLSRKAIDLIGAFDSQLKGSLVSPVSNASTNKLDILPQLDLSLRRSHPSSSVNQVNDENRRLNHSDASAFSRYISKPLQSRNSTSPSTCNQQNETNSEKQLSNQAPDYNSDTHGPAATSFQQGLQETEVPHPQQRDISQPIPVRGIRIENVINGYSPAMPQMYRVPSGLSPLPSPSTASYPRPFNQLNTFYPSDCQPSRSPKINSILDQRFGTATDHTDNKHVQKLGSLEDQSHASSANERSANSSFYNGHMGHQYSIGPGSNGKIIAISVVKPPAECSNEDGFQVQDRTAHRSMQREVALTKFRMKRKERCFEKKVRYESRKKLAEQRPRVKGQFVRQATNDTQRSSGS